MEERFQIWERKAREELEKRIPDIKNITVNKFKEQIQNKL
jgi:hypothetical protein